MILALLLGTVAIGGAWDGSYRYPVKVRFPALGSTGPGAGSPEQGNSSVSGLGGWRMPAGAAEGTILCPSRDYSFAIGMRPFFSHLRGSARAQSKGGEGSLLNLHGHLRLPADMTQWELYAHLRLWERIAAKIEYWSWQWAGSGHSGTFGDFAGLLLEVDQPITSDLEITTFLVGGDYDVRLSRDVVFGPNADLHVFKWHQRVATQPSGASDFAQTMLQPTIGAHLRYEPMYTGYFSWFKPYLETRFGWMNITGLGLSTWDLAAGVAPPVSTNVDAGVRLGYKQWKLDGHRGRLFADVGVEGMYLDLSLRF
jgi:hypothetical protein